MKWKDMWVKSLPSMSRCCREGQLAASSSTSESQTVRLAVRKSLRRRGKLRARCWKHPVLLCRVGHQPRSSSSSILREQDSTRVTRHTHSDVHWIPVLISFFLLSLDKKTFVVYSPETVCNAYLQPVTSSARPRSVRFLQRHRSRERSE